MVTESTLNISTPHLLMRCEGITIQDSNLFLSKLFHLPTTAYIELTHLCNNRCPGHMDESYIANSVDGELNANSSCPPLNAWDWERILNELEPNLHFVNITGGEPTLHPDFLRIVTLLEQRGIHFAIFTNGRWRKPIELIQTLVNFSYFQGFLISLHGANAKSHDAFSGVPGSFDETIANILLARRIGLPVTMSTVITHQNACELNNIIALSQNLGISEVTFNRYFLNSQKGSFVPSNIHQQLFPSNDELRQAIWEIQKLEKTFKNALQIRFGTCIPQCFAASSSRGCAAGEDFLAVDPWGNVKPCTDSVLVCGNLLQQRLNDIWWGERMESWRSFIPDGCTSCAMLSTCRTGCKASAMLSSQKHDPLMIAPIQNHPKKNQMGEPSAKSRNLTTDSHGMRRSRG